MKKRRLLFLLPVLIGALSFGAGLYMYITINGLKFLTLSFKTQDIFIQLNKWLMIVGVGLVVLGVLLFFSFRYLQKKRHAKMDQPSQS